MRLSWSCGVIVGFILATAIAGTAFYFLALRKNPELSAQGMQQIEKTWEKAKQTGDKAIESAKPYAVPAEAAVKQL